MLDLHADDVLVMPKMPSPGQFTIARVSGRYRFEISPECPNDFGHVVPIDPESVRTFANRANEQAFAVSALFSRANHRAAVTSCGDAERSEDVRRLLDMESNREEKLPSELLAVATDDVFRRTAEAFQKTVTGWNGNVFEEAVRQRFMDLGYTVQAARRYDGKGSDIDMLVSPPTDGHSLFMPTEIAVQVKWKQGIDQNDADAVEQIWKWANWQGSKAKKYVISSAAGFTDEAREKAEDCGVELICGLQTMCFLLGIAEFYREGWENPT